MKRTAALVLTLFMMTGFFQFGSIAAEPEQQNYLTHKWEATFFPGELTETVEDGATVTTYVPQSPQPWFSPQLSVYDDLKSTFAGREYVDVCFCMELRGVFSGGSGTTNLGFLIRAVDPNSGSYAYSVEATEDWNGEGDSWLSIYNYRQDEGNLSFKVDFGGNVMAILSPTTVTVSEDDWTLFESEPIRISAEALADDLFGDMVLCMDFAQGGFTDGFEGIQIRNTAIYEFDESSRTPEPTPEPTSEPTEKPENTPGEGDGEQMAEPVYIFDFQDDDTYILGLGSACITELTDDGLLMTVLGDDPFVSIGTMMVSGSDAPWVVIRYRGEAAVDKRIGEIYFATEDRPFSESTRIYTEWGNVTQEWQTLVTYSGMLSKLDEEITEVRFDPYSNAQGSAALVMDEWLEIQFVAFFKTEEEARAFDYEKYSVAPPAPTKAPQGDKDTWTKPAASERYVIAADNAKGTLTMKSDAGEGTLTVSYGSGDAKKTFVVPDNAYFRNGPLSGTDELGRSLPDSHTVIDPDYVSRDEEGNAILYDAESRTVGVYGENGRKYVGIFYFLWHGTMNYDSDRPRNIQELLDQYGDAAKDKKEIWGSVGSTFYFAKPLYGYYTSDDEWVIRKHMELLTNAGIDFLYFDVTNNYLYDRSALKIMEICHEMNLQGYAAPKVVFYTHSDAEERVLQAYRLIYAKEKFPDTWLMVDGKPLIIAPAEANVDDFFTIRVPQWPNEGVRYNSWPWIEFDWPQKTYGRDLNEAISVSVAQHNGNIEFSSSALYDYRGNRGRSYDGYSDAPTADSYKQGVNFGLQLNRAIDSGVPYVMVTGWNEWIANRMNPMTEEYPICFMDTFDLEYSRDIEMTEGAYFDNYYMQLAAGVSSIRGAAPEIVRDDRRSIDVAGDFSQWSMVGHYYTDPSGDAAERDTDGVAGEHYVNKTGRNDIVRIKVTGDASCLYFYAECAEDIKKGSGSDSWMQILLNVDGNTTGWLGYDYVACYKTKGDNVATLARAKGNSYDFEEVAELTYQVSGNQMMVAIPLDALGIAYFNKIDLSFKWIDSSSLIKTAEQLYTDGDCAPLGRPDFTYRTYAKDAQPAKLMKTVKLSERKAAYEKDQKGIDPIVYVDANKTVPGWVIPVAVAGGALAAGAAAAVAASGAKKRKKKENAAD